MALERSLFSNSVLCAFLSLHIFCLIPWMIPLQSQDERAKQPSFDEKTKLKNNERVYIKDASLAPEKQFEPWMSRDSSDRVMPSKMELPNTSYFTRNYGWDEIEQNEEETERLRQLLSIWDAERIAILKLQHDLDKNVFQRTFDYIKRIGQSIGLALWLWVHRPANCSNISNLHQQDFACSDTGNNSNLIGNEEQKGQEYSIPSIDTLPDSLWLKHFVLDETEEYLPPIARAMKNMLDHNALICTDENLHEKIWPHFINQSRVTQNKTYLRNMHENNDHPLLPSKNSPLHTADKKKPNIEVTDSNARTTKMNTPIHQNIGKYFIINQPKKKNRSTSRSPKSSHRSKSKRKRKHVKSHTTSHL